jgi:phosphohistidine phosphatase
LVVMRHATARTQAESDHERVLSERGLAEAADVARRLHGLGVQPELALVSDAARARQTWAAVERECGPCEVDCTGAMYAASTDTVLEALRSVRPTVATVTYVGHNPTAQHLAAVLSDGEGDPAAMRALLAGMRPATAVLFEVEVGWDEVAPGVARVVDVLRPSR